MSSHANTLFLSIGHRCSSVAMLDLAVAPHESMPFDTLVSQLDVVRDCLENGFEEFLNPDNYARPTTHTVNLIDGEVVPCEHESPRVNRYFERRFGDRRGANAGGDANLNGRSTYHLQLALTHHDLAFPEDVASYTRRSERLLAALEQQRKKVCLYIHPILGPQAYAQQKAQLLDKFTGFAAFMAGRYPNTTCLFFIMVRTADASVAEPSELVLKNDCCSIYLIRANKGFIDAGGPFLGDCEREIQVMKDIIQQPELAEPLKHRVHFPLFDDVEAESNEVRQTLEGLRAHPQVVLVDTAEAADVVILCQNHLVGHNPFHVEFQVLKTRHFERTIMLDYSDDPVEILDAADFQWRLYFKRSCVDRDNGRVMDYGGFPIRPTAYCVSDEMCEPPASTATSDATSTSRPRPIDVSCLFDDGVIETPHYTMARGRLLKFAKRFAAARPQLVTQLGTVSPCGPVGRARVDPAYKRCLYDSKIVLHANPDPWEGDSRLWEALAAGALVFVDRMHAPIENPLVDGEHLIFYDLTDEGLRLLEQKVLHYLNDDAARERIGAQGRAFVLEHHRSVNRVDAIIQALERTTPSHHDHTGAVTSSTARLDIVVSIATGYKNIDQYRQFVSTLRRTGATCPLFLGISDGPEFEPVKRYLLENGVNAFLVPPIDPPHKVVNGYRFAQYRQWLRRLDFRYALMMDFRDAYFQRDPFVDIERFMHDCDLYLMSEFQLLTVGNHPNGMNYDWVAQPFGKETADAIADRPILNSGAILGRKAAIMKLLDAFTEVTTAQNFDFADQGTLNYLGHTGQLESCGRIKIVAAGESLVNNCGFTELDLLRETRTITAAEEARIAFIPRSADGRLQLCRDHEGWVLDDDGNISYAVHQYDRFAPEMDEFVARLSDHECPDRIFVNSGTRPYRGEKFTLASQTGWTGLRPDAMERLIKTIKGAPAHKKPLLVLDRQFRRGFAFGYGVLNVDLLFKPISFRRGFFQPTFDVHKRLHFLRHFGYELILVDEASIFRLPEPRRDVAQTAQSFAEARAQAERWLAP
ncbi:MAG TPA: DUF1796 family putative cysteine peptidase [Polyangia bacterium]